MNEIIPGVPLVAVGDPIPSISRVVGNHHQPHICATRAFERLSITKIIFVFLGYLS
jgi:hypothetical protein